MWGDMSLWNVQGPLLHSGDHTVPRILTVDYTFNSCILNVEGRLSSSIKIAAYYYFSVTLKVLTFEKIMICITEGSVVTQGAGTSIT